MKILFLKNGKTTLEEVPAPIIKAGHVLIRTTHSLVSLGTERMLVEFGEANLINKARQQPDKVRQVVDKIKTDGLKPTLETVINKLEQPLPLGYCNVGEVVEVGEGVSQFAVGDRVASNGNHAEYVCVPQNLVAKIPDEVTNREATFTIIGAIGLQSIRLLAPQMGETIVVIGLGLIGLVTAQLLKAHGCHVIGVDLDPQKIALAKAWGIDTIQPPLGGDTVKQVIHYTQGVGADGVIITASSPSNSVIHEACEMSRKRGRIVLVGVVGLDIRRDDFYKKELTFQVSCSYGPGRYDPEYEQKGNDYPIAYVRWTEKRNFETILTAIAQKTLDVQSLITEEVELTDYPTIYGDMRKEGSIASIIRYPHKAPLDRVLPIRETTFGSTAHTTIGIIGAGNYTSSMLLPCLKKTEASIRYIASAQGLNASILAQKAKATYATSDYLQILQDNKVNLVMIATRHNLHAPMVLKAIEARKNVFVEKPLCLTQSELQAIIEAQAQHTDNTITVGFNRRFSPFAQKLKSLLGSEAVNIVATMNAGAIPPEMWVHDMQVGGGRILGEACHFIDLCSFLAGSKVVAVCMNALGVNPKENTDNASILLKYKNGSNAVINYFANGSKAYAKERIEVFSQERVFVIDNWRRLEGYGVKGFRKMTGKLDKGQKNMFATLVERSTQGGEALIPFDSLVNTTLAGLAAIRSLKEKQWIPITLE